MTEQELRKIPEMKRQLDRRMERLEYLQSKATGTPPMNDSERVQTSITNKSMAMADAAMDLELKLADEIEELKRIRVEANTFIDSSSLNSQEKELMRLRYVKCLFWYDVADVMQYHMVYVQQMHMAIMKKLFDLSDYFVIDFPEEHKIPEKGSARYTMILPDIDEEKRIRNIGNKYAYVWHGSEISDNETTAYWLHNIYNKEIKDAKKEIEREKRLGYNYRHISILKEYIHLLESYSEELELSYDIYDIKTIDEVNRF